MPLRGKQLRKGFLQRKNILNYSFYALGEILIVLIGIYLAVAANNYNLGLQEKEKETQILQGLLANLKADTVEFKFNMKVREYMKKKDSTVLATLTINKQDYPGFIYDFRYVSANNIYVEIQDTYFGELNNIGLDIISNPVLKSKLRQLYEFDYPRLRKLENELAEYDRQKILYELMSFYIGIAYDPQSQKRDLIFVEMDKLWEDSRLHYQIATYRRRNLFVLEKGYQPTYQFVLELIKMIEGELAKQ